MSALIGVAGVAAWELGQEGRAVLLERLERDDRFLMGAWFSASSGLPYFMGSTPQPAQEGTVAVTYVGDQALPVVARMIARHGEDALAYLEGTFAVAWFDQRGGMIRLARDATGASLHVAVSPFGGSIMWASQVEALEEDWIASSVPAGHVITIDPRQGLVVDDHLWAHTAVLFDERS